MPFTAKPRLQKKTIGNGPAVCLLHGWGMHSGLWAPFATALATNYTVHCIDLPGCGFNHACEHPYNMATLSAEIINLLDEPTIVIGWSLGGLIATHLAVNFPELVERLILIASSPYFIGSDTWPGVSADNLIAFSEQLTTDSQATMQQFFQLQCLGLNKPQQTYQSLQQIWQTQPMPTMPALVGGLQLLATTDHRSILPSLTQPTLMIYGKNDRLVPPEVEQHVSDHAGISHHTIAHATHMPFFTHTTNCHEHIQDWLT